MAPTVIMGKASSPGAEAISSSLVKDEEASRASLLLAFYVTLLAVTNIVVIIPTARQYAERLGADETFSGLTISLTPFFTVVGIFLNKWMLRFTSMKTVLFLMAFGGVIGNCLYALGGLIKSKWSILIARSLVGLCAAQVIPPLYIAQAVKIQERSNAMFKYQSAAVSGYVLGPLLAWALESFMKEIHYENLFLDSDTIPGWFMACVYLLLMLKVFIVFENPPAISPSESREGYAALPLHGFLTCLYMICAVTISNSMLEVYLSKIAAERWQWSVRATSLYIASVSAFLAPICLFAGRLAALVQDRKGIMILGPFGIIFSSLLLDFELGTFGEVTILTLGAVIILAVVTLTKPLIMSVVTKIVTPELKGFTSTLTIAFLCLGRGIGALLGSVMEPKTVTLAHVGIFGSTIILTAANYSKLEQHHSAS